MPVAAASGLGPEAPSAEGDPPSPDYPGSKTGRGRTPALRLVRVPGAAVSLCERAAARRSPSPPGEFTRRRGRRVGQHASISVYR